jgi:hypothetical protein
MSPTRFDAENRKNPEMPGAWDTCALEIAEKVLGERISIDEAQKLVDTADPLKKGEGHSSLNTGRRDLACDTRRFIINDPRSFKTAWYGLMEMLLWPIVENHEEDRKMYERLTAPDFPRYDLYKSFADEGPFKQAKANEVWMKREHRPFIDIVFNGLKTPKPSVAAIKAHIDSKLDEPMTPMKMSFIEHIDKILLPYLLVTIDQLNKLGTHDRSDMIAKITLALRWFTGLRAECIKHGADEPTVVDDKHIRLTPSKQKKFVPRSIVKPVLAPAQQIVDAIKVVRHFSPRLTKKGNRSKGTRNRDDVVFDEIIGKQYGSAHGVTRGIHCRRIVERCVEYGYHPTTKEQKICMDALGHDGQFVNSAWLFYQTVVITDDSGVAIPRKQPIGKKRKRSDDASESIGSTEEETEEEEATHNDEEIDAANMLLELA